MKKLSGSTSAARTFKRGRSRSKNKKRNIMSNVTKHEIPTNVNICGTCENSGYETTNKIIMCSFCKNYDGYRPMEKIS